MKLRAISAMIGTALSIFAVAAPCVASDASANAIRGGGSPSSPRVVAPLYARPDAPPETARAIRGRVVKVADGDTATILDASNRQHKIRFHGIDAPEKSQAFGKAAAKHLASLIAGREVTVKVQDVDQYGRTVGKVFADGRDINLEMLRAGYAWHYRRFDKSPSYAAAESEARSAKRGLWSDPHPINPADFRKAKREKKGR